MGSLANRVRLQHEYESFFIIADLHTLTTKPDKESVSKVPGYVRDLVLERPSQDFDMVVEGDAIALAKQWS